MLRLFGADPFLAINGDAYWEDTVVGNALSRLLMVLIRINGYSDILIRLKTWFWPKESEIMIGLKTGRRCAQRPSGNVHMFTGIRVVNPRFSIYGKREFIRFEQMDEAGNRKDGCLQSNMTGWHHIFRHRKMLAWSKKHGLNFISNYVRCDFIEFNSISGEKMTITVGDKFPEITFKAFGRRGYGGF